MIELTWYQNNNMASNHYKKWYVRPVIKQMLSIHEMAQHMAEHNTPFSPGTIEGILTDFSKCIREQLLNGNSVKIDNLAIFKITLHSRPFDNIGGIDTKTGRLGAAPKIGSAVRRARLLASATGDMMSRQIGLDITFGWDTESQSRINAEKKKVIAGLQQLEELGEQVEKEKGETGAAGGNNAGDNGGTHDAGGSGAPSDNGVTHDDTGGEHAATGAKPSAGGDAGAEDDAK